MGLVFNLILALVYWACLGLAAHALANTKVFRRSAATKSCSPEDGLPPINSIVFVVMLIIVLLLSFSFGTQMIYFL